MKTKNWSRRKIIGSIAEMCVEQHLEKLGYKVEKKQSMTNYLILKIACY